MHRFRFAKRERLSHEPGEALPERVVEALNRVANACFCKWVDLFVCERALYFVFA